MYVTLSFKFGSREEVEKFLTFLEKHLRQNYLVITRLTHVYVQIEGQREDVEEAVALVKSLAGLAKSRRGRRQIPLLVLFRDADLVRPIPPDVIADALTLRGFNSAVRGGYLETDAEYGEVLKTAEELSRLYQLAEKYPLTPQAKKIVVAYAYGRGVDIDAAVQKLIDEGVLNRGSVISIKGTLEETRRRLLKI